MDQRQDHGPVYMCPMHSDVRQPNPGKCQKCGMNLLPEGTRFAMLRHLLSSPWHMVIMAAVMLAVMVAAMLLPEGARFTLLWHVISSPLHIAIMAAVMLAVVVAAMMTMRR